MILLLWLLFPMNSNGDKEKQLVYFGFPPFFSQEELHAQFTPLIEYLAQQTGARLQMKVAKDYDQLLRWLQNGEISFAHLSPYAYVKATERVELTLLATVISEGESSFRGIIIAHGKTPIAGLQDLAGRSFAFVDTKSSSGFIYPRALLIQQGYDPSHFLGKTGFCGDHLAVIQAVLSGQYDAGATYDGALKIARRKSLPVDDLKIVAQSNPIPHDAYVAIKSVDTELCNKVKKALLALNPETETGKKILSKIGWIEGWEINQDKKYQVVKDLIHYGRERHRLGILPLTAVGETIEEAGAQEIAESCISAITRTQRFFILLLAQPRGRLTPQEIIKLGRQHHIDFIGEPVVVKSRHNISLSLRLYECRGGSLQKVYVAEGEMAGLKNVVLQMVQNVASDHPLRGIVSETTPPQFMIDLGRLHGAQVSDVVELYSQGEEIRNPVTDEVVGRSEKVLARGKVVDVFFDTALCSIEGEARIAPGTGVKLYAGLPVPELAPRAREDKAGRLKVISVPSGARIWLDGKETAFKTPHIFEELPHKNYVVRLDMLYYQSEQQVAVVLPDEETTLSMTLTPFHETNFGLWVVGSIGTLLLVLWTVGLRLIDWKFKNRQRQCKISLQELGKFLEKLPYPLSKSLSQYKKGKLSPQEMATLIDQFLISVLLAEQGQSWKKWISDIPWETLREQLLAEHGPGDLRNFPWTQKVCQFYHSNQPHWWVLGTSGISAGEWKLIGGWRLFSALWNKKCPEVRDFLIHKEAPEELQICRVDAIVAQFVEFFQEWRLWVCQGNNLQMELQDLPGWQICEITGPKTEESHLYVEWGEKRLDLWPYAVYLTPVTLWPLPKFFFLDKVLPANGYCNHYISYDQGVREEAIMHLSYWKQILPQKIPDEAKRTEVEKQLSRLLESLAQLWSTTPPNTERGENA